MRVRGDGCHWGGRGRGEGRVVGDEVLHVKGGDRGCHRPPHWLVGPGLVDGVPAEEETTALIKRERVSLCYLLAGHTQRSRILPSNLSC